jgi:hypothetical protein
VSRRGEIVRPWGDEDRTFRLGIGEWRAIQEKCDAGPGEIAGRLATYAAMRQANPKAGLLALLSGGGVGAWRVDDIREPLYRGLIGGGLDPTRAGRVLRDLHDERPLMENIDLALEVVLASLVGAEDDPPGELEREPTSATPTSSREES